MDYSKKILVILAGLFGFRLLVALLLPLSPQETYYWVFSLHPALSYFDHPPLVAQTIFLFSRALGHHVLAVRLGALLFALGTSWLVFRIGKRMFDDKVAFWAVLLMNLTPTFSMTAMIMTPDSPLLFFWCLTWFLMLKVLQENRYQWYLVAGLAAGLALTSKYSAFFLPLSLFIFLIFSSAFRHHLKRVEPYGGLILALAVFSPVVIWNAQNGWASFAFQSTQRAGALTGLQWDEFLGFLGSQMGILSPLIFIGLGWTIYMGLKRYWKDRLWPETFLLSLSLPMIFFFTSVAFVEWVKINWLIPAYPPLLLLMTAYYQNRIIVLHWAPAFARCLWAVVLIFFVLLHLAPFIPQIPASGSTDTLTGWKQLAGQLETIQKKSDRTPPPFIFAWGHKTASELQFYLKGQPETYAQNVIGQKALGYDYWFDPKPLLGRDALFVWSDFDRFPYENSGLLEKYFDQVELLEPFTIYRGKIPLRTFRIYRCTKYKGREGGVEG
ncbi:MAG: glycosyltransferase family 39 protein [Thermodesulfobacteriota bacterium]